MRSLVQKTYAALASILWSGIIRGFPFPNEVTTDYCIPYLTTQWLTDEHEMQMLDLLKTDLLRSGQAAGVKVETVYFLSRLIYIYETDHNGYLSNSVYR